MSAVDVTAPTGSDRDGGVEIRLARAEEFEAIDRMLEAAYTNDYGPSDNDGDPLRSSRARAEHFDVWVAVGPAGELLGSVTTRRLGGPGLHEDAAENVLDLRLLGVAPTARRRGIGAALMRRIADEAARSGFDAVALKTQPRMSGAHRLYEGLGFARTPEHDGLWIDGRKVLDLLSYRYPLRLHAENARRVLGSFPSGVVVLAARNPDDPAGAAPALTVQAFFSLSLDPLRVAVAVGRASTSWPRIAAGGSFAITVLAEDQGPLARRLSRPGPDKLAGVPLLESRRGHPLIAGGVSWLDCDIHAVHDGGDHLLVVADVRDLGVFERDASDPVTPLVFSDSRFTGLARG